MFLFLKSISTYVYSKFKDEIPPREIDSHKVVGGEPALVLLFREHLHHFIIHCVLVVSIPVAEYYVLHFESLNRHGVNLDITLHIQLGLEL